MVKKQLKWINTCERFVAFIDIMGFKEMVLISNHNEVKNILTSFWPTIGVVTWARKRTITKNRLVVFSDSIILLSNNGSKKAADDILFDTQWIIRNAISQEIPIKGAIAYGEQTADFKKSLHFGKPLIHTFELQEALSLYGVILHHTMEKRLIKLGMLQELEYQNIIFKYQVPIKSEKISHFLLNWTSHSKKKDSLKATTKLYNSVSGVPRIYVDNTLEFVRWITARKAELAQKKKAPSHPSIKSKKSRK